jgi:Flp pilus assembly protein TadG
MTIKSRGGNFGKVPNGNDRPEYLCDYVLEFINRQIIQEPEETGLKASIHKHEREVVTRNRKRQYGREAMKMLKDESGQAMILTLLCMTCLLGFVGFAVDVGVLLNAKRQMQTAADSAAIAGALEQSYTDMTTSADAAAALNGVTVGVNGGAVTINTPPLSGAYAGKSGYVEAIVSQSQPTFFMKMFNFASMKVSARAVATLGDSNGCIYTLGTTGPDIQMTGNASVSVANCGIVDNSSSNDALDLTGNVSLTAQSIGIVGKASDTGNVHVTPAPVTGIEPVGDPLASLPTPTVPSGCTNNVSLTGNKTQTLSPGCYSGISATGNVTLNLNPGTYVINGGFGGFTGNVNINGTGVTLVLLGSSSLIGNVNLNLSAPTSGSYSGVLIDQPSSNTNAISLTGNAGSTLKGVIYAPGAAVTLTGNSGSNIYADFVVKSLTLIGNSGFNDYASLAGNADPLTSARLVE